MPERSLLEGTVYFPHLDAGYLRIQGEDREAFLQRQSSNDIRQLAPGRAVLTILTSPAARILDVLRLVLEDQAIGAITLPGYKAHTAQYLKSRIFFMDKVTVADASEEFHQIDLDGKQAGELLLRLGIERAPEKEEVLSVEYTGSRLRAIGQAGFAGTGYRLMAPRAATEAVEAALSNGGAIRLDREAYEILRVEAGLPASGSELAEEYTPLEVGLREAISDTKGCYTGQEVIARQLTYDKVTQHLAGLRLDAPVQPGTRLWAENRPAGTITSFVQSPTFGPIALAVIKRPYHEPGVRVTTGAAPEGVGGVVSALPFGKAD